ncbi:MAG: small multidrug export protein, partial [Oscillospiraceae bacterium]|nr:small multidrug export protein [Oscillospiraceae bacterium]
MLEQIFEFFLGAGREAALFIISMIPLIELRGSIPFGAALGMPW